VGSTDLRTLGRRARDAAKVLAASSSAPRDDALARAAELLEAETDAILAANEADRRLGQGAGLSETALDRLTLSAARIAGMAQGLRDVAALPDPVGEIEDGWRRPNGLSVSRVRVPLGVVGVIYENRPNVTSDAAGLCLKAGNAAFLRGSSSALRSNQAVVSVLRRALAKAGLAVSDLDLIEINEAFAQVAIQSMRDLGVGPDVVNVNGGAIAIGHPIGASGARLAVHLCYELGRRGGGLGAAGLCGGGGQGEALLLRVHG